MQEIIKRRRHYFLGIGGIGMSALAEFAHCNGCEVTGSDRSSNEQIMRLRQRGIEVKIGHSIDDIRSDDVVIYSTALLHNNAELLEACRQKTSILYHRAELARQLGETAKIVAISGTHGKTTTSALVAHIMESANYDPSAIIGGNLVNWQGSNMRAGQSDYMVIEADESDGSLLNLQPYAVILHNVEPDHIDHHKSYANLKQTFVKFVEKLPSDGLLVANGDEQSALQICHRAQKQAVLYGFAKHNDYRVSILEQNQGKMTLNLAYRGSDYAVSSRLYGSHNASNITAAFALCHQLGIEIESIIAAIQTFKGTQRRQEYKGSYAGWQIYDDYAHHPTAVSETIKAFRDNFNAPLQVIFQPHLYSRTKMFISEFASALSLADKVYVTDIYAAREKVDKAMNIQMINGIIAKMKAGTSAQYVPDWINFRPPRINAGIFITMGAGDISQLGDILCSEA